MSCAFEKFYLDERTADVYFMFEPEGKEPERIPAHKIILSATSNVFDAMFYGKTEQDSNIEHSIVDTTPEAFKEFLQFFYCGTVRLTTENVYAVMSLGKQHMPKHMLDNCFRACFDVFKKSMAIDNACSGYELAILFDDFDFKKFCEQVICENVEKVFQSKSFLNCDSSLLRHILKLDSLKCDELIIFDGLIAWAKTAVTKKDLDETSDNLRSQLGDLLYEIRFGEMKLEDFYARYNTHRGLFSIEDFEQIIGMIASKKYPSGKFNRKPRGIRTYVVSKDAKRRKLSN